MDDERLQTTHDASALDAQLIREKQLAFDMDQEIMQLEMARGKKSGKKDKDKKDKKDKKSSRKSQKVKDDFGDMRRT